MYIQKINWGLLIFCLIVVFYFQKNPVHMEAAYGLFSITLTMMMTTILLIAWLWK